MGARKKMVRNWCAPPGYALSHKQRNQLAADVLQALRTARGRKRISCKSSWVTRGTVRSWSGGISNWIFAQHRVGVAPTDERSVVAVS